MSEPLKPTHWVVECKVKDDGTKPTGPSYRYQVSPAFRPTFDKGIPTRKLFNRENTAVWHARRLMGWGVDAVVVPYILMPFTIGDAIAADLPVSDEDRWPYTVSQYTEDWYGRKANT